MGLTFSSSKIDTEYLSICHWNISLSAHNFAKLTQLEAYNSVYEHNFIYLSETFLELATPKNLLEIEAYNFVRADHLNNVKIGGVCIYQKESLSVRAINVPYFNEMLLLDVSQHSVPIAKITRNLTYFCLSLKSFN